MDAFLNNLITLSDDECVIPLAESREDEVEPCTLWVQNKDYFIPDISITIHDKLPPGVYRMEVVDRDWQAHKVDINTDELYTFTDDYTSTILNEVSNFWNKKDLYKQFNIAHKRA